MQKKAYCRCEEYAQPQSHIGRRETVQEKATMSLREMCAATGISRRTVQGYESIGLLKPTGKTQMGHLYYDHAAQNRVHRIHQYQKYGFRLKEIAVLLDAPREELCERLEGRLAVLLQKQRDMSETIAALRGDIRELK